MKKQQINMVPVEKLIPYVNNARKHSEQQVSQIAASIKEFGFVNPILVDAENVLIAGHGRLAAAHKLGLKEVPCLRVEHLTEAQKRAYILADNRLAELAEWDKELLNLELTQLKDLDFNFELTGFDQDFVDEIQPIKEGLTDEDAVPEVDEEKTPVSKRGMIWLLGKHRLRCGDSTDESDVAALMNGEKADLLHTDPPYGVDYEGVNNDHLKNEMLREFIKKALTAAFNNLRPGANAYIWHADIHSYEFIGAFRDSGFIQARPSIIQWVKDSLVLSQGDYHSRNEPCIYGWKKGENRVRVKDRKQDTIWEFPKPKRAEGHPTMKPVDLCARAILNSSEINNTVLDLFGGSGSTLIACEKTTRRCVIMELNETYVDLIIKRWQEFTGQKAILEGTDKTFDDLAAEQ